jgi:Zn-dependent M28 family amino/carboxypeptidase
MDYGTVEYEHVETGRKRWSAKKKFVFIGVFAGISLAIALIVLIVVLATLKPNDNNGGNNEVKPVSSLAAAMDIDKLMGHLKQLDDIGTAHGNTRALGTAGYNESVNYVANQLRTQTNYNVVIQSFPVTRFKEVEPSGLSQAKPTERKFVEGTDFLNMGAFAGLRNLTDAPVGIVPDFGCRSTDYVAHTICLVSRGVCAFQEKVDAAAAAGCQAILIYNQGDTPDRMNVFSGSLPGNVSIPVFSLSYVIGQDLKVDGVTLNLFVHTTEYDVITYNIIADTKEGDPNSVIVVGSHLDSVPAGKGINDNGSGSSGNLELALQLYQLLTKQSNPLSIENKVRFAWWGAEEVGLLGSTYYVNEINKTGEISTIAMNINLDMIGSPNYFRGIYNGSGAEPNIRSGSVAIQAVFEEAFAEQDGSPGYELTEFTGRSDYGPFIATGVPAGGLFTGAEVVKDDKGRSMYGGLANAAFDPCYHQYCDNLANIHRGVLLQNAQAAAYVLEEFAALPNLKHYLATFLHPGTASSASSETSSQTSEISTQTSEISTTTSETSATSTTEASTTSSTTDATTTDTHSTEPSATSTTDATTSDTHATDTSTATSTTDATSDTHSTGSSEANSAATTDTH